MCGGGTAHFFLSQRLSKVNLRKDGKFFTYTPGTPPYDPPGQLMRAPRMWGVERDPRASLGRRGAHGEGLVGVFGAVSMAAVESLRGSLVSPWGRCGNPHVSFWPPVRAHGHPTRVGDRKGSHGASR